MSSVNIGAAEIFHGVGFLKKGNERVVCLRELELDYLGKEEELRQSGHGQEYKGQKTFSEERTVAVLEKDRNSVTLTLISYTILKACVRYILEEELKVLGTKMG